MLVPWSVLQTSLQARRWRHAGCAIGFAAAAALIAAAYAASPFDTHLLLLGVVAGAWSCFAVRPRSSRVIEVGVWPGGQIVVREYRRTEDEASNAVALAEALPVDVSFASTWLISLRRGTMLISIWPDCLPQSTYRRLWVHLHWGRAAATDDDKPATPEIP